MKAMLFINIIVSPAADAAPLGYSIGMDRATNYCKSGRSAKASSIDKKGMEEEVRRATKRVVAQYRRTFDRLVEYDKHHQ